MRSTIIAIGLFAFVALVSSENCAMPSDCTTLACTGMEACEHGLCTCHAHGNMHCVSQADCATMHVHGHCTMENFHCLDGRCHCMHN